MRTIGPSLTCLRQFLKAVNTTRRLSGQCPECDGTGEVETDLGDDKAPGISVCPRCKGSKKV